jgi:hypothetical protein
MTGKPNVQVTAHLAKGEIFLRLKDGMSLLACKSETTAIVPKTHSRVGL